MTDTLVMIVGLLADEAPKDTGPDFGKASPFGLLVVVLLLIGTFLLVRSMNRHLKRLPEGEWVGLDAVTYPEPHGIGLADTVLWDERGRLGRGARSEERARTGASVSRE